MDLADDGVFCGGGCVYDKVAGIECGPCAGGGEGPCFDEGGGLQGERFGGGGALGRAAGGARVTPVGGHVDGSGHGSGLGYAQAHGGGMKPRGDRKIGWPDVLGIDPVGSLHEEIFHGVQAGRPAVGADALGIGDLGGDGGGLLIGDGPQTGIGIRTAPEFEPAVYIFAHKVRIGEQARIPELILAEVGDTVG